MCYDLLKILRIRAQIMICIFTQENAGIHVAVLYFVYPPLKLFPMCNFLFYSNLIDQYPGNCPPLSPLSQHFALSEKQVAGGGGGGGGRRMIQFCFAFFSLELSERRAIIFE